MTQPTIVNPHEGRDDAGKLWVQAIVDPKGRVLAGRDAQLNFHLFSSAEELFDNAIAALYQAHGIDVDDIVKTERNGDDA